jgi:four helix bundle protein
MDKSIKTFEDLKAWQEARVLTREIYAMTRSGALAKDFGLCSQIRRAAVSTMANLAEGFERQHLAEKIQFYNVAHASNGEVRCLTYVVEDNYQMCAENAASVRSLARQTGALVAGLLRATQARRPA